MKVHSPTVKNELQTRLRRIEGQIRGVQKMVDDDRDCREIIQQLTAVRAAVQNARLQFLRQYASECLLQGVNLSVTEQTGMINELISLVGKVE
jgi:CsoR family transcriptional regulator, copper-sensing transcriptional repressor